MSDIEKSDVEKTEVDKSESSGGVPFYIMLVVLAFVVVVCMIMPLAVADFAKQAYAVPLMGAALALPFLFFFIFGGMAIAKK